MPSPPLARSLLVLVTLLGGAARAADGAPSWGLRLGVGGAVGLGADATAAFELAPRVELLFGQRVRVGPALEFRTANFQTAELVGEVEAVFPTDDEFAVLANLGAGYAGRRSEGGAIITGSLAWGVAHVLGRWEASTTLYVSYRHAVTGPPHDELAVGVSFGGGVLAMVLRIARGSL